MQHLLLILSFLTVQEYTSFNFVNCIQISQWGPHYICKINCRLGECSETPFSPYIECLIACDLNSAPYTNSSMGPPTLFQQILRNNLILYLDMLQLLRINIEFNNSKLFIFIVCIRTIQSAARLFI